MNEDISLDKALTNVRLQIHDTAGQERFRHVTRSYYRDIHGAIIVYDITDSESFKNVKHWIQDLGQNAPEKIVKILIGNKVDLVGLEGSDTSPQNGKKQDR